MCWKFPDQVNKMESGFTILKFLNFFLFLNFSIHLSVWFYTNSVGSCGTSSFAIIAENKVFPVEFGLCRELTTLANIPYMHLITVAARATCVEGFFLLIS